MLHYHENITMQNYINSHGTIVVVKYLEYHINSICTYTWTCKSIGTMVYMKIPWYYHQIPLLYLDTTKVMFARVLGHDWNITKTINNRQWKRMRLISSQHWQTTEQYNSGSVPHPLSFSLMATSLRLIASYLQPISSLFTVIACQSHAASVNNVHPQLGNVHGACTGQLELSPGGSPGLAAKWNASPQLNGNHFSFISPCAWPCLSSPVWGEGRRGLAAGWWGLSRGWRGTLEKRSLPDAGPEPRSRQGKEALEWSDCLVQDAVVLRKVANSIAPF